MSEEKDETHETQTTQFIEDAEPKPPSEEADEIESRSFVAYNKAGENHYNIIKAVDEEDTDDREGD